MKTKGMIYAASAAAFWAISGISGQILLQQFSFTANWLVSARMLVSGFVLILISQGSHKGKLFAIFKKPKDALALILFGIFGMYAVQAGFFQTIAFSNASFATIIQFTGPVFIIFYEGFRQRRWPSFQTIFLLLLTFVGILLLATHGNLHQLIVPKMAIIMGLIAALAIAIYSILPRQLISDYGSLSVVGWGMLIGGTFANLIHPFWHPTGTFTLFSVSQFLIVAIVGTALSFFCYSQSLRYISPSLAAILTAVEPLLSLVFSIIIFQMAFGWIEWVGFLMVFCSILLIQKQL
ncbi:EamA family transporter [Enterococcus cecorum]|uniref:DMT family transporter n=1 Tax=Enterococcus cecorum TaxID=44008 RepID=UPI0022D5BC45|nr:EamA family transporter [Enterococcus cecorum]MDZ5572791.1 EamA family transporter [Enterococcus cecorum]CAI3467699.1 EamA family transporter [Enterococcus cecorum]